MNKLIPETLDNMKLPDKFLKYYNFRVSSFIDWLSKEYNINTTEWVTLKNQKCWEIIIKNFLLKWDLEFTLNKSRYIQFSELSFEDFSEELDSNVNLVNLILLWEVLIWYEEDFSNVFIIIPSYETSDVVYTLIN